ncbi:hypothetical protein TPA0910_14500 [Streptomyces hygroscopicus subsp. sporocinereus]|uniref:Uncharacterized protein n=1 Tax=Streptomyces hygroscopicus TaxID=1912 RepID=A0ABQ3TUK6_STRHY|nr:hypothetical protein [Streptomyces hygroscopicus]GHJ27017.1 hypothetical protein TPA0910_14500 [Streptomyces hygroscopicus]
MTRRPYHRPPDGRDRDRTERDRVVEVLLARLDRGALSPAEAALLGEHVREYRRLAEENRRAMIGTTRALAKHREAADAAICEAEQAEEIARTAYQCSNEAERQRAATEQQLAESRAALSRVRVLAQRMRAGSPQGAAALYADRIEQALDNDRRALDPDTAIRAQFLAAADSTTARLAEQQREHDVALAASRRNVVEASREAREHKRRAERYRLAWLAARRDRKADRVAMRADLATMQAAEQRLAAVRAALPTAPRPRLGLPNDLAYQHGRHDLADAVRDALDDRA